ncbi:hypothetical protein HRbin34_00060 [bacterium HR34]|nr:hypothetical protein HRbin34_00060 [bacterium HR34]
MANNKTENKEGLTKLLFYLDKKLDNFLEKPLDKIDKKVVKIKREKRVFYFYLLFFATASLIILSFIKFSFLKILQ